MRTNQPAPGRCWEPAENPSPASGWVSGAALQKALISLLSPLCSLSLRFRHNIILIPILSPLLLLPLPFPAGSLPPCRLQRLSMRTSCLPKLFPLGAGPGQGEVGTVWVVAAWLSPASRTLFLLPLSSLNGGGTPGIWGWLWGHPTLEHLRCARGWDTGSTRIWDVPLASSLPRPSHLQPSQHGLAWVTDCSSLALFVSGARLWGRLPRCSSLGLSVWRVLGTESSHWDLESCLPACSNTQEGFRDPGDASKAGK